VANKWKPEPEHPRENNTHMMLTPYAHLIVEILDVLCGCLAMSLLRPKINCRTRALALQEIGGTISLGLGDFKLLLLSLRTLVRDKSCHNLYKMIVFWGIVVLGVMVMAMVMLMMVVLVVVPVVTVMVYMVVFVGMVLFLGWQ
jgi:hypothetical protein